MNQETGEPVNQNAVASSSSAAIEPVQTSQRVSPKPADPQGVADERPADASATPTDGTSPPSVPTASEGLANVVPQPNALAAGGPSAETALTGVEAAAEPPMGPAVVNSSAAVPDATVDFAAAEAARIGEATNLSRGTESKPSATFTQVADQVSSALEQAIAQKPKPLRMTLDPPELGTLGIEIVERNGRVEVRIEAELADTSRLLRDHVESIRELAARTLQSLEGGSENVDVQVGHRDSGAQRDRDAKSESHDGRSNQAEADPADRRESDRPAARTATSSTALDLKA